MAIHSHDFVERYDGLVGFGLDRESNENTLIVYLQKLSDDKAVKTLVQRMSDAELDHCFTYISELLRTHLSETEYHRIFLKDDHP